MQRVFGYIFLIILIVGCGLSSRAASSGFDVNDVSFLFPLRDGKPYPAIRLNDNTKLISDDLFKQVLQFEHQVDDLNQLPYINARFLADQNQWYVTSFRYEDCGNTFHHEVIKDPKTNSDVILLGAGNGCQAHLRLVIQPFNFSNQPLPTALHLIYNILPNEQVEVVNGLAMIKSVSSTLGDTSGLPLMVHPGLEAEGQSVSGGHKLADQITQFLLTSLSASGQTPSLRVQLITMTINTQVMGWKMVGGFVSNQKWTRFVTNFNQLLYDPSGRENILLGVEQIQCNFYDFCFSFPNKVETSQRGLLTTGFKQNADGSPPAPQRNYETEVMAEQIDNGLRTHFFNTNCLSCHESANFRNRNEIWTDLQLPAGITPFTIKKLTSTNSSNIINFGYEGLSARVSTRTASESALVASRLNQFLNTTNPGYRPNNLKAFWQCLMREKIYTNCFTNN
ncbi:MAG: hypothetical protein H7061_04365 [Bdellovibrionaceae bacterium]|nr:hypothetical protein [Bdellovibrio sp.]